MAQDRARIGSCSVVASIVMAAAGCASGPEPSLDLSTARPLDPAKAYVVHSGFLEPHIDINAADPACRFSSAPECAIVTADLTHRHLAYRIIEAPPGRLRIDGFHSPSDDVFLAMHRTPIDVDLRPGRVHYLGNHILYRVRNLKDPVVARQVRRCDFVFEVDRRYAFVCPRPVNFEAFLSETPLLSENADAIDVVRYGRPVADYEVVRMLPGMVARLAKMGEVVDFRFHETPARVAPYERLDGSAP